MRNDRDSWSGWADLAARSARRMPAVGGLLAVALGIGTAAPRSAFAQVPDATFSATMEVLGSDDNGGSTPGTYTIDNYCDAFGCGSASAMMTSNVAGEQTTSGSALSSRDVGANSSIDIVYYFMFAGPAGGTVLYHWSGSGSTSLFGGGAAFANLYKNSVPQGDACSSSVVGNCGSVSDAFNFNIELSAPANTAQMVEIQLSGSTAGFGGGPYTATIDPLITIDPSSAAQGYSLELSPNVTQDSVAPSVPEASTWAMLLAGFAALGFAYRAQRRVSCTLKG
jgi:PEP-CTERM motif